MHTAVQNLDSRAGKNYLTPWVACVMGAKLPSSYINNASSVPNFLSEAIKIFSFVDTIARLKNVRGDLSFQKDFDCSLTANEIHPSVRRRIRVDFSNDFSKVVSLPD